VPSVLVAGTNGKGSTAALLAAMATSAGYRTGFYSSPHLESPRERVRIDGQAIGGDELGRQLARVLASAASRGEPTPTYFEALTAAGFLAFAERRLDLAVLEVGLGGRLDATNLAAPILSVITSLSLDHQAELGPTVVHIAREKAGILRAGTPAVAWVDDAEAAAVLVAEAAGLHASLELANHGVQILDATPTPEGQRVSLATPSRRYLELDLHLGGRHQTHNLGLAVRAAEALAGLGWSGLDQTAIARGVSRCRWPGRLELVELPGGKCVLLDAAHNPGGAVALAAALLARQPATEWDLLFGALADKDVPAILPAVARGARQVVLTRPDSPRALDPAFLVSLAEGAGAVEPRVESDPGRALELALQGPSPLLVVCGSIYLLGTIRQALHARFGVPTPAADLLIA
jgi:dihydrofolate synthase/folylpolyglutamate synthase